MEDKRAKKMRPDFLYVFDHFFSLYYYINLGRRKTGRGTAEKWWSHSHARPDAGSGFARGPSFYYTQVRKEREHVRNVCCSRRFLGLVYIYLNSGVYTHRNFRNLWAHHRWCGQSPHSIHQMRKERKGSAPAVPILFPTLAPMFP